jgi:hypothetical protein
VRNNYICVLNFYEAQNTQQQQTHHIIYIKKRASDERYEAKG